MYRLIPGGKGGPKKKKKRCTDWKRKIKPYSQMTNRLGRKPQGINRKTGTSKQVQQSCRTQGQYTKYTPAMNNWNSKLR